MAYRDRARGNGFQVFNSVCLSQDWLDYASVINTPNISVVGTVEVFSHSRCISSTGRYPVFSHSRCISSTGWYPVFSHSCCISSTGGYPVFSHSRCISIWVSFLQDILYCDHPYNGKGSSFCSVTDSMGKASLIACFTAEGPGQSCMPCV